MNISIVLADDHELVRTGIRMLLERHRGFCVVGEASNGHEAVELVHSLSPKVAILDISMPLVGGIEAARRIHKDCPNTAIIIMSMYTDEGHVLDSLFAGALGYVLKSMASSEFFNAVQTVADHRLYLSSSLAAKVMHAVQASDGEGDPGQLLRKLSTREREILHLVVEGYSSAQIAVRLGLSSTTVDTYRSRLMAKLHINNLPNLVRFAIRHGLLPSE